MNVRETKSEQVAFYSQWVYNTISLILKSLNLNTLPSSSITIVSHMRDISTTKVFLLYTAMLLMVVNITREIIFLFNLSCFVLNTNNSRFNLNKRNFHFNRKWLSFRVREKTTKMCIWYIFEHVLSQHFLERCRTDSGKQFA